MAVIGRSGDIYKDYYGYIRSWEWRYFRETIMAARDYTCERCEWSAPDVRLHLHHIDPDYLCLGKETEEDVEVLCERCHREEHGLLNVTGQFDYSSFSQTAISRIHPT